LKSRIQEDEKGKMVFSLWNVLAPRLSTWFDEVNIVSTKA